MDIAVWKQRKAVEMLNQCEGNSTSLITILLPPDTQLAKVSQMLTKEIGTASSIKSRVTRQGVLDALKAIQGKLKNISWLTDNGLAIFCGTIETEENDKFRRVTHLIEPIKPIPQFVYKCDKRFHSESLSEMLVSENKYGFIVVDGAGALYATVQGNTTNVLYRLSVQLPKKHGRGGQSALRFARLRLSARHNYLTKVAELATKFFINSETNKINVGGLVLAGSADFKDKLGDAKFFDPRLKEKVISVVDVSYGFTQGLQQAIELSAEALKDSELIAQKHLMSKFFEEIAIDSNKSCFGIDATMASLESGAVDTLIVWEELAAVRHVVQEKATGKNHIIYCNSPDASPLKQFDQEAVEIKDSMPLLDWLAENFHNFGAKMEIVQDATAEGSQFCRGFGGLGALLRYAYNAAQEFEDTAENGDEDVWYENTKKEQSGDYQSDEDDVWGRSVYGSSTQTAAESSSGKHEMESFEEIF